MSYVNSYNGDDVSAAKQFEFIAQALSALQLKAPEYHKEPTRPRTGRIVVADGVDWNPIAAGVPRLVWFNGTTWVALNA